jgi:hypothetical protein
LDGAIIGRSLAARLIFVGNGAELMQFLVKLFVLRVLYFFPQLGERWIE